MLFVLDGIGFFDLCGKTGMSFLSLLSGYHIVRRALVYFNSAPKRLQSS